MSSKLGAVIVLIAVFGVGALAFMSVNRHDKKPSDSLTINIQRNNEETSDIPNPIAVSPKTATTNPSPLTKPENQITPKNQAVVYSANVSYDVPENNETLALTISISNGLVTDVNVSQSKTGRKSANYQTNFEKSYKQFVIGKQLKDINLSRVGGASITTNAFMEAIKAVQKQAL
jgi:uncharacterized protein with FMN-binding domain